MIYRLLSGATSIHHFSKSTWSVSGTSLSRLLSSVQHNNLGVWIPVSCFRPFSPVWSSLILCTERERKTACWSEEEREVFLCHTLSGLLSLFTLRLGNSFRFSRISCRQTEHRECQDYTQCAAASLLFLHKDYKNHQLTFVSLFCTWKLEC